jgi:hypothetical protein
VLDVSNAHCGDTPYFNKLFAEIHSPKFLPALLQFLLSRDISQF